MCHQQNERQTKDKIKEQAQPVPLKLGCHHLAIGALLRKIYFYRLDVVGEALSTRPTLFIASHRNGAVDGIVYMQALGDTPSLISIQLLRNWFLRLFFSGIAVVRKKDCQRYGLTSDSIVSPIEAAVKQIGAAGDLCIYPEGTSRLGYQPLSYKAGMAMIVQRLKQQKIDFVVQSAGIFYSQADAFCSRATVVLGKSFVPKGDDVKSIYQELSQSLAAVSVNCASRTQYEAVKMTAWQQAKRENKSFGDCFLQIQQNATTTQFGHLVKTNHTTRIWAKTLFFIGFPIVSGMAIAAQQFADERNNISFFRLLGGMVGGAIQLLVLLAVMISSPTVGVAWLSLGVLGYYFYPEAQVKSEAINQ